MMPVETIKRAVAREFGIPPEAMTCRRRLAAWARPRQVAMYLAVELVPTHTLPQIARAFGRDHSTVMHAVEAVERRAAVDPKLKRRVDRLRAALIPQLQPQSREVPHVPA